jgi:TRAP-type C4-dicarboxylate transport system permease small subunit
MAAIRRISFRINQVVEYLLFGLGFSMAVIVAVQVFFRYVLNQSLFWSEELARFLLVWLTFLGASVAYYRKVNPGVDVLYARMGPALRRASTLLIHLVSIALFAVMLVYGWRFAHFVRLQISPALNLPKWIVMSVVPISGSVLLVHGIAFFLQELTRGRRDD